MRVPLPLLRKAVSAQTMVIGRNRVLRTLAIAPSVCLAHTETIHTRRSTATPQCKGSLRFPP